MGQRIGRNLDRDARSSERLHEQKTDRSAAEDGGSRPRPGPAEVDRVQRDAERLD